MRHVVGEERQRTYAGDAAALREHLAAVGMGEIRSEHRADPDSYVPGLLGK